MYRPSGVQPRGAWARHLDAQRKARGLSQTEAFELVYERIPWSRKSRSAYRAIDIGERQPNDHEAAVLAEEFGWPSEADTLTTHAGQDDLAAAIREQTTVISALVVELRREREEGRDVATAFDRAATALLSSLRPGDTEESAEQSALRWTGR